MNVKMAPNKIMFVQKMFFSAIQIILMHIFAYIQQDGCTLSSARYAGTRHRL